LGLTAKEQELHPLAQEIAFFLKKSGAILL